MLPLQVSPVQVAGGFLLLAALSTLVANTAAYFALGDDAELRSAVGPGLAMATAMLTLAVLPPYAVIPLALAADFVAVRLSYRLNWRGAAVVTAVHYALTLVVALFANYTLALYQTAPG